MNQEVKSHNEILSVGQKVSYLEKAWTITHKAMPADMRSRRFLALERINPIGSHERIEVEGPAWELVRLE